VSALDVIALTLGVAAVLYLVVALLAPERF